MCDVAGEVNHPRIIQGGMGVGVSSWRLARAVAALGEFGVVSGTGIDTVVVRELQQGDPHNRRRVLQAYPDQEIVRYLVQRFYIDGGIADGVPYKLLPLHGFRPTVRSQRILSAATFSEVRLAKEGHSGLVGINLMAKLKRFTLAGMYGAMLAGADAIFMGAGIPAEEPIALRQLAAGEPARLRLEVDTSAAPDHLRSADHHYELDPAKLLHDPQPLRVPDFYPVIASDLLARILVKKLPNDAIAGWIIEGPTAGGHNAPPRGKQYDDSENPVYDGRDEVDLKQIAGLGYPFYLAGGYASPRKLNAAVAAGAAGIQVGTLFSLADESGYPEADKRRVIEAVHRGEVSVRTDGRVSPTGFPFKVVDIAGADAGPAQQRQRVCDLGYLQTAVIDARGRIQGRCPAEDVAAYVKKGGKVEDTVRRACLCNALMSNVGLGQRRPRGAEPQIFTAGDDLVELSLGSIESPHYSAADVIHYLRGTQKDIPLSQTARDHA